MPVKSYITLEMPGTVPISETILDTRSMDRSLPGKAGTPVMKSCVMNGLMTTDLQQDGTLSSWDLKQV